MISLTYLFILLFVKSSLTFIIKSNVNYYANECSCLNASDSLSVAETIQKAYSDIEKIRVAYKIPGVVTGISIKGKTIWTEGFGLIDIENNVVTHRDSVWRMASISKSLTSALIGKLIESGKINLNGNNFWNRFGSLLIPMRQRGFLFSCDGQFGHDYFYLQAAI